MSEEKTETVRENRVRKFFDQEGGALQSELETTNINKIIAAFTATGVQPRQAAQIGHYGDFSDAPSLHEAYNRVHATQEAFMALPSDVRGAARNNPLDFANMLEDEEGRAMLVQAGLELGEESPSLEAPETEAPEEQEVAETAPTKD